MLGRLILRILVLTGATVILAGGSCDNRAAVSINERDYSSAPSPALIRLSDPLVFSRETLINDRRREAAFLEEELTNSKSATFEPELRRDLATISALTAQLGIKFDPGVELNFERKEELDSLRQDIARTKLEAQLELAQRELEDVRAGESDSVTGPESEQLTNSVTAPDTADIKGKLTSLVTETTNFLKAIGEQGDGLARPSAVGQSPENDFEDRQAFRQRIRARLAAMNLDDVHDSDGNALYRLQFRAAIAPGPNDRRWGVALVTAKPPTLDETELTRLYYQWLSHINARMYARTEADGTVALESLYLRAGAPAGLYSVAQVCLPVDTTPAARGRCREGETQFYIAVHPAVAATITEHLADDRKRQAAKKALASSVCNNTKLAQDILNAQISVEASIAGFSAEAGAFGAQILTAARIVIADYDRVYSLARNYLGICRASIEPALNSKRVELENADRAYQSRWPLRKGQTHRMRRETRAVRRLDRVRCVRIPTS